MSAAIHASCVSIGGKGVLLLGASGAGKSDLALRLIDGGARLVADDACELFVRGGKLCARAPASIAGLLELRGQGIIAMPCAKSVALALAVDLRPSPARLPEPAFFKPPKGLKEANRLPLIMVKAEAASAPARIRMGLAAFLNGGFRDTFNPKSPS
jgi:hypothetical protein